MIRNFSSVALGGLISTIATYFLTVILSHLLTTEEYGMMARWLTDIGYVSIFFTLGLNASMIFFTRHDIRISESMGLNLVMYTSILVVMIIVTLLFASKWLYLLTLLFTVFFFSLNEVVRANYQFEQKFRMFNFMVVFRPLLLLAVFFFLYYSVRSIEIDTSLIFYTISMAASTMLFYLIYFFNGNRISFPSRNRLNYKHYFSYGAKSILNRLLSLSLYAISIYMVSRMGDYTYVAYFFVASSISKMVWVLPDSSGNILYPIFIKATDEEKKREALKSMYTHAQLVFLLNTLALLLFWLLGRWILSILYEEVYQQAFVPILILLVGNQGMVYYKLFSRWHAAQNTWRYVYIATALGIITNVLLNLVLIARYGLLGVAIATSISFWVCGIAICLPIEGSFWNFLNLANLWKRRAVIWR